MTHETSYDCAIIGGGLAGLSLAIQLCNAGFKVILFEKEQYPFHKVCGEYISMESWDHLQSLGLPLPEMDLPRINKLLVSSPNGNQLTQTLDLGGFGISRYTLDFALKKIAEERGVTVMDNCKVENVIFNNDQFQINSSKGKYLSRVCCGCFGKRSNLDIGWKRPFVNRLPNKLNHFIGIKYHVKADMPADLIALHNFENGYCGMSKIENDTYCLCYLSNAANLKNSHQSIEEMEKNILSANPFLADIFKHVTKIYTAPLTISQISFQTKSQVEDHVLMIGDAAGMITPLCGNGMSMALHASKIASKHITRFLNNKTNRSALEKNYEMEWRKTFSARLRMGRTIQRFFGKTWITNLFVRVLKRMPAITKMLIRQTHGKSF